MYEQYYGLKESPFQLTPDPRYFYFSAGHQEAWSRLLLGLKLRRGFVVLSGEVGTGKTTILRSIMDTMDPDTHTALIFHTLLSAKGLLQCICREFGIDSEGSQSRTDYIMRLQEFLQGLSEQNSSAVLIIDEAHNLKEEILEEIRLLSNIETAENKVLQIFLSGQPELLDTLARPEIRQLNQRISMRYTLRTLSLKETGEYIRHRLKIAGLNMVGDLFTPEAVKAVYLAAEGVPRRINIICENALVMGYVRSQKVITKEVVDDVTHDDVYQEMGVAALKEAKVDKPVHQAPGGSATKEKGETLVAGGYGEDTPTPDAAGFDSNGKHTPGTSLHTDRDEYDELYQSEVTAPLEQAKPAHDFVRRDAAERINPFLEPATTENGTDPRFMSPERPGARKNTMAGMSLSPDQLFEEVLSRLQDYLLIRKPNTGAIVALVMIIVMSYVLAILIAITVLEKI
ncbi:MAG TPA: AAA family ATPase [Bacteroidetes bacterium]|nr:AAA family ATPase [Bacteroidota bacterium]